MSVDKSPTWKERADDLARSMRLDVELAELRRPGMTNAEVERRLSPDLRSLFWQRELDAYFDKALNPEATS